MSIPERIKRWRSVLAVCIWVTAWAAAPGAAAAQGSGDALLQQVQRAFSQGDARALLEESADRIEISLFGVSTLYSRSQAMYVMQDFFRQYPPGRCALQEPAKTDGNWFAGGSYWYEPAGHRLQVYVRVRQKDRHWELREIRVEQRTRE